MPPSRLRPLSLAALAACSSAGGLEPVVDPFTDPTAIETRLRRTLDELAAFGEKRAGTTAGQQAGDYIAARFEAAGLQDVRFESFAFLGFELQSSSLTVSADGTELPMAHDVFAYSGVGEVTAEIVDVGVGHEGDYAGKDVTGKVVLVTRDAGFHRSSQYRLVTEHGGVAMLYISTSPDNLIQVGTVADPEDGLGPLPVITVGADDGATIVAALEDGQTVTATLNVQASVAPATGRNVIGRRPGTASQGEYLLFGAHYDTWHAGAADNITGVATVIELAEALAARDPGRHDLVFVAYDAEELGLFGGYDYLRDRVIVAGEPMLGFLNFEMPAAGESGLRALAYTADGPVEPAIDEADMRALYTFSVGMEVVPAMFGGIIPADIQGLYWTGAQGFTTACDAPYYHTPEDTPDRIDVPFLARAVLGFHKTVALLHQAEPESFAVRDPNLWQLEVTTATDAGDLTVDIVVTDAGGTPQPQAQVTAWLDVDDFVRTHRAELTTDGAGTTSTVIPASALTQGSGSRWLHVTAGKDYPLAERIVPVD